MPDAMADAQTALEILGQERWGDTATMPHTAYASVLTERGDPGRALEALGAIKRPHLDRFVWEYHWYLMVRGRALAADGDVDGALEVFGACGASMAEAGLTNPVLAPWWLETACLLGEAGRGEEAGRAAAHGTRLAERWGTRRALGYAALARGAAARGAARTGALREAVALLADSPARSGHARGLLLLGRALVEDGAVREGREHLREAVGLARRCGCVALARRARDELIAAGGRMREVTASPLDMLTGTERTVAGLVASGAGNREVAESLFVTVRTVELHLTSVYRKLGVARRADLTEALRGAGATARRLRRGGRDMRSGEIHRKNSGLHTLTCCTAQMYDLHMPPIELPLLERDRELAALSAVIGELGSGRPAVVTVTGEPGLGQNDLLRWAAAYATDAGLRVLGAHATPAEHEVRYGVVAQLLAEENRALAPRLFLTDEQPGGLPGLNGLLNAVRDRPTLLVVRDTQWLDPASLRWLEALARRLPRAPVALLTSTTGTALTRPEWSVGTP
ncbi:AAA family ATPase [Actinomadura keratinilytica]